MTIRWGRVVAVLASLVAVLGALWLTTSLGWGVLAVAAFVSVIIVLGVILVGLVEADRAGNP